MTAKLRKSALNSCWMDGALDYAARSYYRSVVRIFHLSPCRNSSWSLGPILPAIVPTTTVSCASPRYLAVQRQVRRASNSTLSSASPVRSLRTTSPKPPRLLPQPSPRRLTPFLLHPSRCPTRHRQLRISRAETRRLTSIGICSNSLLDTHRVRCTALTYPQAKRSLSSTTKTQTWGASLSRGM